MRLLALVLVAGLAGGCTVHFGDDGPADVWVESTETIDLAAGGYDCVDVTTHNGRIEVAARADLRETVTLVARRKAGSEDEWDARAALAALQVVRRTEGRTLTVASQWSGARDDDWAGRIDFELRVPARLAARLESHNGDLDVTGLAGSVDLMTRNGDVAVRDVRSRVHAESHNGRIECSADGQPIELDTHNGDVFFSTKADRISGTITSHNGDVVLDLPDDARGTIEGRGRFQGGDLGNRGSCVVVDGREFKIELRDPGSARLEVRTHNGSVRLRSAKAERRPAAGRLVRGE